MPLFEYVCGECGSKFEKIVRNHTTSVECVSCNSVKVERQLSVFAVASGGTESAPAEFCGPCEMPGPGCGSVN